MTTNADRRAFSLVDEPWIRVLDQGGRSLELSLRQTFDAAPSIQRIAGELPTQDFAILRILLVILERAAVDAEADPISAWQDLWYTDRLPVDAINAYLDKCYDRFYLVDPEAPFFQVAGLRTDKGKQAPIKKLVAEVPDGHQFFTSRSGQGIESLGLAEAGRWLVHAQAYDPGGSKSGVIGDPTVKDGKSYGGETGWAGRLGGVSAEGRNLRETLLLNLVFDMEDGGQPNAAEGLLLPTWEQLPQSADPTTQSSVPYGRAELFTWPSRAIRLVVDGDRAVGVVLTHGRELKTPNLHNIETMSTWRRSEQQEKKLGVSTAFMPRPHERDRAFWRSLDALMPEADSATQSKDGHPPVGVLRWIGLLGEREVLPGERFVNIRAVGVTYGTQNAVITDVTDDSMAIQALLLFPGNRQLRELAKRAVSAAEEAVSALVRLARNIRIAAGSPGRDVDSGVRARAFFLLDQPFRQWIRDVDERIWPEDRLSAWENDVGSILDRFAVEIVRDAPETAFAGREVGERSAHSWISLGVAVAEFERTLKGALPNRRVDHQKTQMPLPTEKTHEQ
jgi:CRISPR system Cascade subunit CasA